MVAWVVLALGTAGAADLDTLLGADGRLVVFGQATVSAPALPVPETAASARGCIVLAGLDGGQFVGLVDDPCVPELKPVLLEALKAASWSGLEGGSRGVVMLNVSPKGSELQIVVRPQYAVVSRLESLDRGGCGRPPNGEKLDSCPAQIALQGGEMGILPLTVEAIGPRQPDCTLQPHGPFRVKLSGRPVQVKGVFPSVWVPGELAAFAVSWVSAPCPDGLPSHSEALGQPPEVPLCPEALGELPEGAVLSCTPRSTSK